MFDVNELLSKRNQKEALKYLDNHLKNKVIEAEMLVERNMKNSKKKGR